MYECSGRDIVAVACAAREELNTRVDLSPTTGQYRTLGKIIYTNAWPIILLPVL